MSRAPEAETADHDSDWRTGALVGAAGFVAAFVVVVMVGVTILAIATGGDDGDEPVATTGSGEAVDAAGGGQTIVATEFAFTPPITQTGTQVELTLVNEGAAFHNLEIEGVEGFLIEVDAGESATASIDLAAGNYVLWCSVPGHREAGMEGSLIVG